MADARGLEWFRPLWRRIAVTAFCIVWSGWEWLWNHDSTWGAITAGLALWAIWTFFITFERNVGPPRPPADGQPPPR